MLIKQHTAYTYQYYLSRKCNRPTQERYQCSIDFFCIQDKTKLNEAQVDMNIRKQPWVPRVRWLSFYLSEFIT